MRNIQSAVSRLEFGPSTKAVKITDIKQGLTVFRPKPGKRFSLVALEKSLKANSYRADSVSITATGTLEEVAMPGQASEKALAVGVKETGNRFVLKDTGAGASSSEVGKVGAVVTVTGRVQPIDGTKDEEGVYWLTLQPLQPERARP